MGRDELSRLLGSARRSILTAALLGVAAACWVRANLALEWWFVWKAAAGLSLGGVLLLQGLPGHHPFARLGIANHITITRGVLVALLAGCIGEGASVQLQSLTFWMAALAVSLDALDGWSARRTNMSSAYGARFDMETDALLILVLSLLSLQFAKAGVWVVGSGLMRYAFIAASIFLPWMQRSLPPSWRRKTVAVTQAMSLVMAVAPFVASGVSTWLCAMTLAALTWSFLVDIAWLKRVSNSTASD